MNCVRKVLAGAVLSLVLVTPTVAAPVSPQAEQIGFALVVGHDIVDNPKIPGLSYEIDVFVVRLPGGSVSGYYRHGGPGGDVVEARCVRVEAGRALVGGIIVKSSIPQQIGMGANLVVDDRGRWGSAGRPDHFRDRTGHGEPLPVLPRAGRGSVGRRGAG